MGSSSIDTCSDNTTNGQLLYDDIPKRPDFYPCEVCGRKFTMRAMAVHKSSCSETEGCRCLVCKIGKKKLKWENVERKSDKEPGTLHHKRSSLKSDPDAPFKPYSRNLLNGKQIKNGAIAEDTISFKLVENHIIDKMVGYSNPERNDEDFAGKFIKSPTYDDHKYISMQAESSDSSNTVAFHPQFSTDQFSMFMKMNDKVDHECSRKIYCSVCDEHVYWEAFAPHLIQHCEVINDNMLKCPGCERVFNKPAYILTHFIVHLLKHPEQCSVCRCDDPNCVEARDRALAEHCYAADSTLYYCYICLTRFSHNQTVSNHMRLHTNEMPFTCTECNRSFRQIGNLQRHMTTHRGDRPHKCPDCCRSFADPATLRNHLRVHTGETPFVCSICKRGFSQVGNLKRHMALHLPKDALASIESVADENAILVNNPEEEAKMCPSPSTVGTPPPQESNNIEQHSSSELNGSSSVDCSSDVSETSGKIKRKKKNQKMKVFTCEICKKVYAWHHDLVVHFRTHTGEKPFECDICGRRFAQSGAVRIHKDRHHPDSVNEPESS